jgi:2-oxoglutarate dehydrogenase E2 component (dihydrolipoamide succinyltransferase)
MFVKENEKIDVGANFVEYDTEGVPTSSSAEPKKAETKAPEQPKEQKKEQPVDKKVEQKPTEKKEAPKEAPKYTPIQFTGSRDQRLEPMTRARKRTAERLKASQNTYAFVSTFNECDMSEATNFRTKYGEEFNKKYGVKLGFMSFFLKAASIALQEMPVVNSVIDGDNILYRNYTDISVAVATPTGLVTPVIRNCEGKSFADFELTLKDLSTAARENKLKIEDLVGGTFTISNGGVYGSMLGTPIINPPQTAILGMHNIVNRPVCRGDEIVARPIMYILL